MAFVNEYIPPDDVKKYGFEQLNRRPNRGSTPADDWTVNREADIWLRQFYMEMDHTAVRGGYTGVSAWDFYWKGNLLWVEVKDGGGGGGYGKPRWQKKKLLRIDIPESLDVHREQIMTDLVSAFTAYKGAGVFATDTDFSFILEM